MTGPAALKAARRASGLSQLHLATAVGVTPGAVQQWESGKHTPRREHVETIERVIDVAPGSLLRSFGYLSPHDELGERVGRLERAVAALLRDAHERGADAGWPAAFDTLRAIL